MLTILLVYKNKQVGKDNGFMAYNNPPLSSDPSLGVEWLVTAIPLAVPGIYGSKQIKLKSVIGR